LEAAALVVVVAVAVSTTTPQTTTTKAANRIGVLTSEAVNRIIAPTLEAVSKTTSKEANRPRTSVEREEQISQTLTKRPNLVDKRQAISIRIRSNGILIRNNWFQSLINYILLVFEVLIDNTKHYNYKFKEINFLIAFLLYLS
jgi:hypothetical protein